MAGGSATESKGVTVGVDGCEQSVGAMRCVVVLKKKVEAARGSNVWRAVRYDGKDNGVGIR